MFYGVYVCFMVLKNSDNENMFQTEMICVIPWGIPYNRINLIVQIQSDKFKNRSFNITLYKVVYIKM